MKKTEEILVVVNNKDEVIDYLPRSICHKYPYAMHREIFVLLFNKKQQWYLQKRSSTKHQFPDMWTVTTSGHVNKGQSYLEAAKREMIEEVGVKVKLKKYKKFFSLRPENNAIIQSYTGLYEKGEFVVDKEEVSEVRAFRSNEIKEMWDKLTPAAQEFFRTTNILDIKSVSYLVNY